MAENSNIEWCDHTFNPWIGCAKVSPGCAHCYAETLDARRFSKTLGGASKLAPVSHWGKGAPRHRTSVENWKGPRKWDAAQGRHQDFMNGSAVRPRVFCASLGDWLDDEVPIEWLADLLGLIWTTPHLDWLLLTKRPQNWAARLGQIHGHMNLDGVMLALSWLVQGIAPANVWIGTTVEDQVRADERIPALLQIPARVRFLSCEPLLGAVSLYLWFPDGSCEKPAYLQPFTGIKKNPDYENGISWVICGGESGAGARVMEADWARSLRDQCAAAGVPFFFKQWGSQASGRLLDGVLHDAFPRASNEQAGSLCHVPGGGLP